MIDTLNGTISITFLCPCISANIPINLIGVCVSVCVRAFLVFLVYSGNYVTLTTLLPENQIELPLLPPTLFLPLLLHLSLSSQRCRILYEDSRRNTRRNGKGQTGLLITYKGECYEVLTSTNLELKCRKMNVRIVIIVVLSHFLCHLFLSHDLMML